MTKLVFLKNYKINNSPNSAIDRLVNLFKFKKKRRLKIIIYSSQFSNVMQIDLRPFQVEGKIKFFDIFMDKTYKVIYSEKMRQIHNSSLYRKRNRSWHRTALRQSSYFTLQVLCVIFTILVSFSPGQCTVCLKS